MTDRELLEKAAKAAGLNIGWDARGAYIVAEGVSGAGDVWNPLTDDGDALRLAVKLQIKVEPRQHRCDVYWFEGIHYRTAHVSDRDVLAATRRAIVRAAAALGEQGK